MLDLNKLQIFLIVAQEGSFSAAAERLYVSQSAVSQHIKDLENGLGNELFDRGWRGVTLTPHGEVLHTYAHQIFELVAEAETALTNVQQLPTGKIDIGATPGLSIYLVPEWIAHFRSIYPRLTVGLKTGITAQIVDEVLGRRVELGFIEGELENYHNSRLVSIVLEEVEQQVIVGFKHPFWDTTTVSMPMLQHQSFIMRQPTSQTRQWLNDILEQHEITPQIGAEFDNLESIKRSVSAGLCLTVLPPYVVRDEVDRGLLRALPVEGAPFKRTLKMIHAGDAHLSPLARAFLDVLSILYPALKTMGSVK